MTCCEAFVEANVITRRAEPLRGHSATIADITLTTLGGDVSTTCKPDSVTGTAR